MGKGNILSHITTSSLAHSVIHLNEVTSTNDLAKQLIAENLAGHGTLIRADFQSKGRGQETSIWESEPGQNLLCSMVWFPQLPVQYQVYLNLTICLGVYDWVQSFLPNHQVTIKWPNDIYVNNQKMAGILVENGIQGNEVKHTIAGMGINVNQRSFKHTNACSISLFTSEEVDLEIASKQLVNCLMLRYNTLQQQQFSELWNDYHRVLYKKDIPTLFEMNGNEFTGIPRAIDTAGRLGVEVKGQIQYFQVKELIWK